MKPQIDALDAETILREAMELAKAYRLPLNLTEAERRELDILIILLGLNRPERNLTETPFLTEKERAQLTEYLDVMGPRLTPRVNAIAREALAGPSAQRQLVRELRGLPRGEAIALLTVKGTLRPPRRVILPRTASRIRARTRQVLTVDA